MIVVDTSALVVILLREPEAPEVMRTLADFDEAVIGAPTLFELRLVMLKRIGLSSVPDVDDLIARLALRVVPFDDAHVALAFDALARFGGAPASLNFGDCMSYAIAKALDAPLLFKGRDFLHTDLKTAPVAS